MSLMCKKCKWFKPKFNIVKGTWGYCTKINTWMGDSSYEYKGCIDIDDIEFDKK